MREQASNQTHPSGDMMTMIMQWMNQAAQSWQTIMQTPTDRRQEIPVSPAPGTSDENKAATGFKPEEILENWLSIARALGQPGISPEAFSDPSVFSMALTHLVQTQWQAFEQLQRQWAGQGNAGSTGANAVDLAKLDEKTINQWAELYDNEFRKFITIPQLGLTKFHQEKINRAMDRFNEMQLAMTRFVHLFYRHVEEEAKQMQQQLARETASGEATDDPKAFYRQWIKVLEGRYMKLFKSEEYLQALQKTMTTKQQYHAARKEVLESVLQYFSMPTSRDIDDVYRALYELKKRIKTIEKQLSTIAGEQSSTAVG